MPNEAVKLGAVDRCLPFGTIAGKIARSARPPLTCLTRARAHRVSRRPPFRARQKAVPAECGTAFGMG
jgi:hypothetical protein